MRKLLSTLLTLTMILSLIGCTTNNGDTPIKDDYYPITLTDQAGFEVTINSKPERIISGYYISSSMLIALGQKDNLVAIEEKAEKRSIYKLSAPGLLNLPNVGSPKDFDLEGCIALNPDLVVLPIRCKESAISLSKMGIKVILINPENEELLLDAVSIIAKATDTQSIANNLIDFINQKKQFLSQQLAGLEKPTVYLSGNSNFLTTAGDNMYQSSLIKLAGAINVAKDITDNNWANISYEQLLTWDPDYIILAAQANYSIEDVLNDKALSQCKAIKNKNVYIIPSNAEDWDSPVPSCILGSIWLASKLHQEAISESKCYEIIGEYYETFYNFTCNK